MTLSAGYEREYGIVFHAPEGISTEAEPSAADVARLIDQVKAEKAAAVFVENITNQRLIEQIASDRPEDRRHAPVPTLSPTDGPASTYIDLMEHRDHAGAILEAEDDGGERIDDPPAAYVSRLVPAQRFRLTSTTPPSAINPPMMPARPGTSPSQKKPIGRRRRHAIEEVGGAQGQAEATGQPHSCHRQ